MERALRCGLAYRIRRRPNEEQLKRFIIDGVIYACRNAMNKKTKESLNSRVRLGRWLAY